MESLSDSNSIAAPSNQSSTGGKSRARATASRIRREAALFAKTGEEPEAFELVPHQRVQRSKPSVDTSVAFSPVGWFRWRCRDLLRREIQVPHGKEHCRDQGS